MDQLLDSIARRIREFEIHRQDAATRVKELDGLFRTVKDIELNQKILGVDGGFLRKEYHGANLLLRRAVGACFTFEKDKLKHVGYHPSRQEIPEPFVVSSEVSEREFNIISSLKRVERELQIAIQSIKAFRPDIVVLDGSIVLHPSSYPDSSMSAFDTYKEVLELYKELYDQCYSNNIGLVGAVEDSKSKRICKQFANKLQINAEILRASTDTLFLYHVLNKGEYTVPQQYHNPEHPFFQDIGRFSNKIYCTYMKCASYDRPLRLDLLGDSEELISAIYKISSQGKNYSYPSVLIEADARAKLAEHEISILRDSIAEKLGRSPSLFELRREVRPF